MGGLGKAVTVFGDGFNTLLDDLNGVLGSYNGGFGV